MGNLVDIKQGEVAAAGRVFKASLSEEVTIRLDLMDRQEPTRKMWMERTLISFTTPQKGPKGWASGCGKLQVWTDRLYRPSPGLLSPSSVWATSGPRSQLFWPLKGWLSIQAPRWPLPGRSEHQGLRGTRGHPEPGTG